MLSTYDNAVVGSGLDRLTENRVMGFRQAGGQARTWDICFKLPGYPIALGEMSHVRA